MIVVKLAGGLGNQLFQYATARSLSLSNNTTLLLDLSFFKKSPNRVYSLEAFNIQAEKAGRKTIYKALNEGNHYFLDTIFNKNRFDENHPLVVKEKTFSFDSEILKRKPPFLLDGYWQSERYFEQHSAVIRNELQLKNTLLFEKSTIVAELQQVNSVCLHLRRSDYLSNAVINSIHGICSDEYYLNAIEMLNTKQKEIKIYIFSDDTHAADLLIKKIGSGINVSRFTKGNQLADFYLMQQCKHHIIANSTYSWWAAWLNSNADKTIIAPKAWFKDAAKDTGDLYPENWKIL